MQEQPPPQGPTPGSETISFLFFSRPLAWDSEGVYEDGVCLHLSIGLPFQSSAFKAAIIFTIKVGR